MLNPLGIGGAPEKGAWFHEDMVSVEKEGNQCGVDESHAGTHLKNLQRQLTTKRWHGSYLGNRPRVVCLGSGVGDLIPVQFIDDRRGLLLVNEYKID
jgi:hypothetical protein